MRKLFLTALAITAAGTIATAQNGLTVIQSENNLQGLSISDNAKFVCGTTSGEDGSSFIYDTESKNVILNSSVVGGDMRSVSDEGKAVGYGNGSVPYVLNADGTASALEYTGTGGIAETVTPDGKLIAGSTNWDQQQYSTHACIWQDNKVTYLPEPTTEWLGWTMNGTAAKYISKDGSVIVGWIIDDIATFPCIVWRKNVDGSYSALPLSRQYFDGGDGTRHYWNFNATGLSRNGRYIALTVQEPDYDEPTLMARYDLKNQTLEVMNADDAGLSPTEGYLSSSIADDGTVVGVLQDVFNQTRKAVIWKAGEEKAKLLAEEFSAISKFAEYDESFHVPTGITPDGKNIVGFASNVDGGYETYIFNIDEYSGPAGIGNAVNGDSDTKNVVARYTTDGKKIKSPAKGINILKMSDGKSVKVTEQ